MTRIETRGLRGDEIEDFKIFKGYEDIDGNIFFKLIEDIITRGHNATLVKNQCILDIRKYSFILRTVNDWKQVSHNCVNASGMNMFTN